MVKAFSHDDGRGTAAAAWRAHARWSTAPAIDVEAYERVVVVAAHPDDESLGAAGLAAGAVRRGVPVELVVITAGEHSHPRSRTITPPALGRLRSAESREAWRELGASGDPVHLGVEDGHVDAAQAAVTTALVDLLGDARSTLVVAPWRHDGHRDHEAAGRAAAAACRRTGADLAEYPIWFWHWSSPEDAAWDDVAVLRLEPTDVDRKERAIRAHRTQVAPLSPGPGDETLLDSSFLEHFAGPVEMYVRSPPTDHALDHLHVEQAEPWGADQRWYERRKRDLTLACLPARRYRNALEVGCSTGVLTQALATRCDQVVGIDSSAAALDAAARRLRGHDGVRLLRIDAPRGWVEGTFDLVVVSEVGYFLSPLDLESLARRIGSSLAADGCVVLCHWRHRVEGWVLDGPQVHRRLVDLLAMPASAGYLDRDVEILVLSDPDRLPDPAR